ncbi:MAG: sulfotransferase family 2 domain-containing protein [Rhodospirillaceae bacterium]|jgi:hypothetical protein|nr:sulfotransferase family 2 domain-containing protein [Rhodospirillaceae bacterium]MBT5567083.1 sulfotransferase family 2 domain-containing protein [Rhodospirillaceae bacterium]MBT6089524.1 sulfotransferase family 2 domain-containing protein [Rhodospirillaceae bacterium]MBT6960908.1 sulfotransferase family 2 domain-containing protein [Rhodospirillaceae bacterium]
MVICDDPAFLFIHVPKAAGTSVAGALVHLDLVRAYKRLKDPAKRAAWLATKDIPEAVLELPIHVTASRAKEALGTKEFEALYRFAAVRNPWDMQLSWYTYNAQTETAPHHKRVIGYADFNDYVRKHLAEHGTLLGPSPQTQFVYDKDGKQLVDTILRYEEIEEGFATVVDKLGITDIELDRFNQSYHAPWTEAYALDTFEMVKQFAQPDADAFGYPDEASAYGIS